VILDRHHVGAIGLHRGRRQGRIGLAALRVRVLAQDLVRLERCRVLEFGDRLLCDVLDAHEPRPVRCRLERLADHDRDRLAIVVHAVILQEQQQLVLGAGLLAVDARRIDRGHHGDDAGLLQRRSGIDARDPPAGDRATDDDAVGDPRECELGRVLRGAGDFARTVDAVDRRSDERYHAMVPTVCRARTTLRRASSILKSLRP
jgi:hypothetical protein